MTRTIAKAPNGWELVDNMPLHKSINNPLPEPVILDQNGIFVASFGAHVGSTLNALKVMHALGAPELRAEEAP